ncbi:MAG: trans-sulfuration enzyme family protein [Shimia sp.]
MSGIKRPPAAPLGVSRPLARAIDPSVVHTSTGPAALDDIYEGREPGFTYSREGHANASALARMVDAMEGVEGGIAVSSGMAAVSCAMLAVLASGDHVLGGDQLYGRSLRMMTQELPRLGIETGFFDPTDIEGARAALRPNTKAILVEVVSNPTLRVADMEGLALLAREAGVLLIVDNTFTTPRGFAPYDHGADLVIHSVTKLLAGHSDAMLGYVSARNPAIADRLRDVAITWGLTPSPFDCWLAERGMLSFDLRLERATGTAAALADALAAHPAIDRVVYPGRADHPDHARAKTLLGQKMGNMVSFEVNGGRAAAEALVSRCSLAFAPTLGDVATTLSHAASSSHRGLTPEARSALGMGEGFFRVSVGIEPTEDVIAALLQALP